MKSSWSAGTLGDQSFNVTMNDATLTLSDPNGGETFISDANETISWTDSGNIPTDCILRYSTTGSFGNIVKYIKFLYHT